MQDFKNRFNRFLKRLEKAELDGFVTAHPATLSYLFNFQGSTGWAVFLGDQPALLVDSRYFEIAQAETRNCQVELCRGSLLEGLEKNLHQASRLHLGFESDRISYAQYLQLEQVAPEARWKPCPQFVDEMRQVKSRFELRLLQENFRRAQKALQASVDLLDRSGRETDFAGLLEQQMRVSGAHGFAFETIIASGSRSSLPHGLASEKRIGQDLLLIDFGLRRKGYCTDLTRVIFDEEAKAIAEIARIVRDARQAAFDMIRPGIAAGEVDAAARTHIEKAGFGEFFGHSLGHGLGLEVHELPRIAPQNQKPLEKGMVFTLEPGIYLPGKFGVRIEDVVVVGEDRAHWISNPQK